MVDRDIVGRQFPREALGQPDYTGTYRIGNNEPVNGLLNRDGRHVNDPAPSLGLHGWQRRANHGDGAHQVELEPLFPGLVINGLE